MSVLIRDMKMPRNCSDCPLQSGVWDCRLTQKIYNWGLTERPSDCPLIEVPSDDVREVVRGEWQREENWETGYGVWVNVCSACRAITPVNVSRYKYCPNCGADMRGDP